MTYKKRLTPWRDAAKPHQDIMEGKFDLSLFAVNIYRVCRGTAPPDYQDPYRFFAKTYLTKAFRSLITSVLRRLDGKPSGAHPITDLMTTFGGGKSHALLCLYHLASHGKEAHKWPGVNELLKEAELQNVPKARIAVLSGEDFDPAYGEEGTKDEPKRRTIWGELAWQLGGQKGYDLLQKNDEIGSAPSAKKLEEVLALNEVNLILIDEALRFLTRSRVIELGPEGEKTSLAAQTLEFFRALTEAVSNTPKTALVATLQASTIEMAREDEPDYWRIVEIFKRLGKPMRLAEAEEIYEIVKRRLFEDTGDIRETRKTANAYFDFYREHKESLPQNVTTQSYLEKLERAYPFHPEFLDVINERWSSIPQFQRTRAILRMLAILIAELYKTDTNPLIQISSAKLGARDFRTEILQQLHAESQFDTVIESDISGTGARAQKIDESGNLTYQREHIAEGVATSIFFYSFGGTAQRPSAMLPNIRLAVLKPGLEPAFIPDAVQLLKKPSTGLFYLEVEGDTFRFTVTPNLNMILAEREAAADKTEIEKMLHDAIQKQISGNKFRLVPFPSEPRDVSDQPQLTLVIMSPEDTIGKTTKEQTTQKILEIVKGGTTYRTYRNCIVFIAPEESHRMAEATRTHVALKDVERLYAKANKLSETQETQLDEMLEDAKKALDQSVWRSYRYIITPAPEDKLEFFDMGIQIQRPDKKISDAVWETLSVRERLAPRIGPTRIISKDLALWPEDKEAITTKELKDAFLTFTHLPMIPNIESLRETIVQGVAEGLFAFARGSAEKNEFHSIKIGSTIDKATIEFLEDTYLLRPKFAYELIGAIPPPEAGKPEEKIPPTGPSVTAPPPGLQLYESVKISADDLDWKKWMEFYDAVIQPLINAGATPKIRTEITGTSEEGIPPNTVDLAIKESLTQYGITANIETKKKQQTTK